MQNFFPSLTEDFPDADENARKPNEALLFCSELIDGTDAGPIHPGEERQFQTFRNNRV